MQWTRIIDIMCIQRDRPVGERFVASVSDGLAGRMPAPHAISGVRVSLGSPAP